MFADLPFELLQAIHEELPSPVDRVSFALSCKSGYAVHQSTDKKAFSALIPQPSLVYRPGCRFDEVFRPLFVQQDDPCSTLRQALYWELQSTTKHQVRCSLVQRLWGWMKCRCVFCGWHHTTVDGASNSSSNGDVSVSHLCLPLPRHGRRSPFEFTDSIPLPALHLTAFCWRNDDPWYWLRYHKHTIRQKYLLARGRYPSHFDDALSRVFPTDKTLQQRCAQASKRRPPITAGIILKALQNDMGDSFRALPSKPGDDLLSLLKIEHWMQNQLCPQDKDSILFRTLASRRKARGTSCDWSAERETQLQHIQHHRGWIHATRKEQEMMRKWLEEMVEEERMASIEEEPKVKMMTPRELDAEEFYIGTGWLEKWPEVPDKKRSHRQRGRRWGERGR